MSNQHPYGYDSNQQPPPFPFTSPTHQHPTYQPDYSQRPPIQRESSDISIKADPSPPGMSSAQFVTPSERNYPQFPPNTYYSDPSSSTGHYLQTPGPPQLQFYPPSTSYESQQIQQDGRPRPPLSLDLPPPTPFLDLNSGQMTPGYNGAQSANSPYHTPYGMPTMGSGSAGSAAGMTEYFPPVTAPTMHASNPPVPTWSSVPPPGPTGKGGRKDGTTNGAKTSRQQFTACGACRHRRVKCDLKDRQEAAEMQAAAEDDLRGPGPQRSSAASRRKKTVCTNCQERGTNCVDEYAPLKAAKQLRRGKRISEIEMLYGRTAASAAVASNPEEGSSDPSRSPSKGQEKEEFIIPDLTREFFDSAFFRRFQIQRPILDPVEFVNRYLSARPPSAAAMGPEGSILCHVLYAWAVSYGVDENGLLDVPEGGEAPDSPIDFSGPGAGEIKRETDRARRKVKMFGVLESILKRIDECGVMRKPSWDGVRALLLILPLTDGVSSPVERLAMYEAAISQVFTLCSHIGVGYDGAPSASSKVNGGTDQAGPNDMHVVRIRIYWYAFVHEGITTGLKGGRLHLDDEDLETMQDSIGNRAVVLNSQSFRAATKFATAPINLALACRLINKALTGPSAKRRRHVDADAVKRAWEALESCWEEFDALRITSPVQAYRTPDEIIRFADGWKIFLFEAQNVIRKSLEERLEKLTTPTGSAAYIVDSGSVDPSAEAVNISHLLDIARDKCEAQTRQIFGIVRLHVGTRFFEWDASLVRDGTYYAALLHAKAGGSADDIAVCIQALNEIRWAHAKAWDRSAELRTEWSANSQRILPLQGWDPASEPTSQFFLGPMRELFPSGSTGPNTLVTGMEGSHSGPGSPYTSPGTLSVVETFSAPVSASGPGGMQQHVYSVQSVPPPGGLPSGGQAGTFHMYDQFSGPPAFQPDLVAGATSNGGHMSFVPAQEYTPGLGMSLMGGGGGAQVPSQAHGSGRGQDGYSHQGQQQHQLQHQQQQHQQQQQQHQQQHQQHSHGFGQLPNIPEGITGQYVVRPDGTQVFIPYSQ